MRKRGLVLVLAVCMLVCSLFAGCANDKKKAAIEKYGSDTLKLYIWGEYMGETLLEDFEEEFGVNVDYELYDSNEMMYTKLSAGDSYDVLVPSDYMIERLIKEDMLQKIDKSLIPNISVLTKAVTSSPYNDFDPGNTYSVPYFWGTVGIVYNTTNVPTAEVEAKGFEIMRDTAYKGNIYMYDSERDSFMIALKALGYSCNTESEEEINAAYDWLVALAKTMDPVYRTDEVIDDMVQGRKDLAIVYSGDAAYILDENEEMSYYTPQCGTNIWSDAMVIPKNAENPLLAHEFINYVLTYDASYGNTETVGYTSANQEVFDDVTAEDGLYAGNEAYIPRTGFTLDEVFHDNETIRKKLSELWIKVKAAGN